MRHSASLAGFSAGRALIDVANDAGKQLQVATEQLEAARANPKARGAAERVEQGEQLVASLEEVRGDASTAAMFGD
jgi:hypothetical protein